MDRINRPDNQDSFISVSVNMLLDADTVCVGGTGKLSAGRLNNRLGQFVSKFEIGKYRYTVCGKLFLPKKKWTGIFFNFFLFHK